VLVLVALPALLTGALVQQFAVAATTSHADLVRGVDVKFRGFPYHAEAMAAASTLPRGLSAYVAGLLWVRASAHPGARINYFFGEVSGEGSFFYFPVALALKLTTAAVCGLVAAAVAVGVTRFRRATAGRRRRLRLLAARGLLPFFLGAAYLGAAMLSNVNIGVRHVAPSIPLFLVAASGVFMTVTARRLRVPFVVVTVFLAGLEAAASFGREIPFGNALAGGASGIRRVLSDSNVDWGERLGAVYARASEGDLGRVGVASLFWDAQAAKEAGVVWVDDFVPGQVDTLFVSVFLWDLGPAFERNREEFPKIVSHREWLSVFMRRIREAAASVEPFGDEYLLIRLRPAASPAAPRD
jgi:hypothetical protein